MTRPISRKMVVDCLLWRAGGPVFTCGICNKVLLPEQEIEFDHIHADVHGGPHEYKNLRPLHKTCHKAKTKTDVQANAKVKRLRGETKGRPKTKWLTRPLKSATKWPKRKMRGRHEHALKNTDDTA